MIVEVNNLQFRTDISLCYHFSLPLQPNVEKTLYTDRSSGLRKPPSYFLLMFDAVVKKFLVNYISHAILFYLTVIIDLNCIF